MTHRLPFDGPPPGWHVATEDLGAYRAGAIHGVSADSIEMHLMRCSWCRSVLAASASSPERERRWEAIAAAVDQPSRWARRATWLRVALGTPHLALTGSALVVLFLAVPLLASLVSERMSVTWFVALAPAIPIVSAVLAYSASTDPAGESGAATPLHSFRIVVLRTTLLLAAALPVGLVTSALLPVPTAPVLGWFLPAVAACALVLVAGIRHNPAWVAGGIAVGWAVVVLVGFSRSRREPLREAVEQLIVNRPAVQIGSLLIAVAAAAWFAVRRDEITYRMTA